MPIARGHGTWDWGQTENATRLLQALLLENLSNENVRILLVALHTKATYVIVLVRAGITQ